MTDPLDFGDDWQTEEENHDHCVLTEEVCGWLARSPHGHPGGCCTCDLEELPVHLMYGFKTLDEWEDSEANRIEARQSLLAWRVEEVLRKDSEATKSSENSLRGNSYQSSVPSTRGAERESRLSSFFELLPNRPAKTVYEQIARDSQEPPRIIPTAYPIKHGSIIISHRFIEGETGNCQRCNLPRPNRIHQAADKETPPVLQALIDAVFHTCDQDCLDDECRFNYRASVNKVRRILNEVQR